MTNNSTTIREEKTTSVIKRGLKAATQERDVQSRATAPLPQDSDEGRSDTFHRTSQQKGTQNDKPEQAEILTEGDGTQPVLAQETTTRRMSKKAFTEALAQVVPQPIYQFEVVPQSDIIDLETAERAIVDGAPGSGKTWALVRRAIQLTSQDPKDIPELLILCATSAERTRLETNLYETAQRFGALSSLQYIKLETFDSFARNLIDRMHRASEIIGGAMRSSQAIQTASAILRDHPEFIGSVGHLLMDDIQNIVGPQAELLVQLTGILPAGSGFTLFGDRCQAIMETPAAKVSMSTVNQTYGQLLHTHNDDALRLAMNKDYRSIDELNALTTPYRQAILTGRASEIAAASEELLHKVRSQDIPWQDLHPFYFRTVMAGATLGILTRTEGEALAVSSLLQSNGILHNLLLSDQEEKHWDGWLGRLLLHLKGSILDEDSFAKAFQSLYPETDPQRYWNALKDLMPDSTDDRFKISAILKKLRSLHDHGILGLPPESATHAVTVSTIRMARGLEFDTVLFASDLLNGGGYTARAQKAAARRTDAEVLADSRLVYVAMTRARRRLYLMMLPIEAVRLSRVRGRHSAGPDRWYKSQIQRMPTAVLKSYRRRRLRAFEIGVAGDLIPESFAFSDAAQIYLETSATQLPNARLELQIDTEGKLPGYILVNPSQSEVHIAATTDDFLYELTSALGYAKNMKRSSIRKEHFPVAFREVYAKRLVTYMGPADTAPPYAKVYDDQAVWLGLEIIGFAKAADGKA